MEQKDYRKHPVPVLGSGHLKYALPDGKSKANLHATLFHQILKEYRLQPVSCKRVGTVA